MFEIKLMQNSSKGANSTEIRSLQSDELNKLLEFVNDNSTELFENGSDDFIDNYYYDAINDCLKDCQDLTNSDKQELNRIKQYFEVAYSLQSEYKDDTANDLFNTADSDLMELAHNRTICKFILEELNMFNIGIDFSEVEE